MVRLVPLVCLAAALAAQAPQPVTLDRQVTGALTAEDPVLEDQSHYDLWIFEADPGTRVRILLTSEQFDTYLSVGAWEADTLATTGTNDDYDPPATDSRLDATVPGEGALYIRVNSFSGGETGTYTLHVTPAPDAPVAGVREIHAGTAAGAEFVDGEPVTRPGGEPAHFWRFQAVAGERYAIAMYSADLDCYLSIGHGVGDAFVSAMDVDDVDGGTDSRIIYEPSDGGALIIRASAFGAETGAYRIAVQRLPPSN